MYKAKSFILKVIIGFMSIAIIAICAIAFIPGSLESKEKTTDGDSELSSTTSVDTSVFADNVQDGQILQCFCWSYNEIMEYLPKIADQGFTAIQTSPVQVCKEATLGQTAKGSWWAYYQPAAFTIDDTLDNALGTPEEFRAMCQMAHSYGVKVLVDVVANHLGNQWVSDSLCERAYYYEWEIAGMSASVEDGGYIPYTGEVWAYGGGTTTPGAANASTTPVIDTYYYKDTLKFHPYLIQDNDEPGNVTQGNIGMMDLDTSDPVVQDAVADYLEELISYGVDGFRFDAAKHIETQWDSISSDFWPYVMDRAETAARNAGRELYAYGEILNRPGIGRSLSWYTNNNVAITDSGMGHNIVENGGSGHSSFNGADGNNYADYKEHMVTWAESHDNYMGTQDTHNKSVEVINKSYAILASRKDFATLYCARFEDYETSLLGSVACLNGWSYPEIGAVNKFHNFYAKADADEACYDANGYTITERYVDSYSQNNGIVIVGNAGGCQVPAYHLADGIYTDCVTGNSFIVSNGTINGNIGESGVAVVYNHFENKTPSITASLASGYITEDYLSVTYTFKNAVSSSVVVGTDKVQSTAESAYVYVNGIQEGQTITVVVTVTSVDGVDCTKTYTYTRFNPVGTVTLYFTNTMNWSTVNAYAWKGGNKNASWPGLALTDTVLDKDGNTCYVYEFDMDSYDHIIFNDGNNQTEDILVAASKQYTLSEKGINCYKVIESDFEPYDGGEIDPIDNSNVITVDFKNDYNWDSVYVYTWRNGSNKANANWPGVKVETLNKDKDGYMACSVDVDLDQFDMIIFNNGGNAKTIDLMLDSETLGFTFDGLFYDFEPYDGGDVIDPIDDSTVITVYFKNDYNWDNVYAYVWNNTTGTNNSWPGTLATYVGKDKDGNIAYSFDVDYQVYDHIIFNNNNGGQTSDLELTSETKGFTFDGSAYTYSPYVDINTSEITVYFKNTDNWDSVYVYLWNNASGNKNAEWPGVKLESIGTDGGYQVYSVTVNLTEYDMIIFDNNSGKQTSNLSLSVTTTGFTANGSSYSYNG